MSGIGDREYRVHLCLGPNCSRRGSHALLPVLEAAIVQAGLSGSVEVIATTCRDRCDYGPSVNVYPGPVFYNLVDDVALNEIVSCHLADGAIAERWLFRPNVARAKANRRSQSA